MILTYDFQLEVRKTTMKQLINKEINMISGGHSCTPLYTFNTAESWGADFMHAGLKTWCVGKVCCQKKDRADGSFSIPVGYNIDGARFPCPSYYDKCAAHDYTYLDTITIPHLGAAAHHVPESKNSYR